MNNLATVNGINQYLELPQVAERLSGKLGHDESLRFKTALSSAISTNGKILECEPSTILNAALIGHSLGLPPSPQLGYYYLVPFKNKKKQCTEAQFQIGYRGYIQLAMRSGSYKKLTVSEVKKGEFASWNPFTEDLKINFIADPAGREKAETVGYTGYFEYNNGFTKMVYWTLKKMEVHADKYSKAYSLANDKLLKAGKIPQKDLWKYSSFWYADFDAMAKKTVLRQLLSKWGSMSVEMQTAYEHDINTECISFNQAQLNASETVNEKAGSETINAAFEEKPASPEPEQPKEPSGEDFLNNEE